MQTWSSREFNRHTSRAMREAEHAPLLITKRGKPAWVLLSYDDYQRLAGTPERAEAAKGGHQAD